ncbi:peptidoglycan DD-metalloendopeptidase family protein [Pseudanabaena sp. PCC 6802]|uniref:peptidoglycan DD-metalloendopeptidase family protein n=1 Tax=Pseudanabaena sp. PCC 6802 TaxID=118173 RepID=UPI001CED66C9|nr:peptidoglycan DD-metalloendopeptidase family protein [Pseudanabaena sp. PCC 6802]
MVANIAFGLASIVANSYLLSPAAMGATGSSGLVPDRKPDAKLELKPALKPNLKLDSKAKPSANPDTTPADSSPDDKSSLCGTPIMDGLKQHKVKKGETLAAIAKQYKLTTATIMGLNPSTRDGTVSPGEILTIPPSNGISYRFGNEETYKSLAKKFNVRADVLFEQNGCQSRPKVVFVPGAVWKPNPVIPKLPAFATLASAPSQPAIIFNSGGYPLPYAVPVTSGYGWRINPVTGESAFHSGIDLGAPMGTPVLAAKSGTVQFAGWSGGYGNLIEIGHDNMGTRYAHLSAIYVNPGQRVAKGQQIGLVGSTGRSTGPHLHFEIMVPSAEGWATLDPAPYLNRIAAVFSQFIPIS